MADVSSKLGAAGVVPVVVINNADKAVLLARALISGGLPCAEVTFRTSVASDAIAQMTAAFPEMLVGAGTVLTIDQAKRASAAGAKFIVAPGFDPRLVDWCIENEIPVFPGCATASDITQAVIRGLEVVKFFPAGQLGGIKMIKALSGPFPGLKFMPTGGVNQENLADYLSCDKVHACGGTWLAKPAAIDANEFDTIEAMVKEAVATVNSIRK